MASAIHFHKLHGYRTPARKRVMDVFFGDPKKMKDIRHA
jgi:hypothetical protein